MVRSKGSWKYPVSKVSSAARQRRCRFFVNDMTTTSSGSCCLVSISRVLLSLTENSLFATSKSILDCGGPEDSNRRVGCRGFISDCVLSPSFLCPPGFHLRGITDTLDSDSSDNGLFWRTFGDFMSDQIGVRRDWSVPVFPRIPNTHHNQMSESDHLNRITQIRAIPQVALWDEEFRLLSYLTPHQTGRLTCAISNLRKLDN